jgi:predicted alpha/beta-fold hydrolase
LPVFRENPALRLLAVRHGGHVGFIARRRPRFWVDQVVVAWLQSLRNTAPAGSVLSSGAEGN